ncbi:hypothetical protein ABZY68_25655 [Streptomyces sp. NPDC006482]|uniref:hypothetical protein n=1 Tax=Streptomyces sp. NPDC006482 TaxID=3154306 RepID=UPI0033AE1340
MTAPTVAAQTFAPLDVIRTALMAMQVRGYFQPTTRQWEKPIPTAFDVLNVLQGGAPYERGDRRRFAEAAATVPLEQAATALAWCVTPPSGANDYRLNLARTARRSAVTERDMALLASGAHAWAIEQKRAARADQAASDAATSRHIGEKDARITVAATVTAVIHQGEKTYGYRTQTEYLVKLRTEDGAVLAWSAKTDKLPSQGDAVTLTGTVKRHTTYRDTATTYVTRCRWTPAG